MLQCVLSLLVLFASSTTTYAKDSIPRRIYSCIFQYGQTKSVNIANKKILIPRTSMPMPYTGTMEKKCYVYTDNIKQNTILLNDFSERFLTLFINSVVTRYNKICKNRDCWDKLDCKTLLSAITDGFDEFIEINKHQYGRLAETKIIFQNINANDKACHSKIQSLYLNYNKKLHPNEKCINNIASSGSGYISGLLSRKDSTLWSKDFINCIREIDEKI